MESSMDSKSHTNQALNLLFTAVNAASQFGQGGQGGNSYANSYAMPPPPPPMGYAYPPTGYYYNSAPVGPSPSPIGGGLRAGVGGVAGDNKIPSTPPGVAPASPPPP